MLKRGEQFRLARRLDALLPEVFDDADHFPVRVRYAKPEAGRSAARLGNALPHRPVGEIRTRERPVDDKHGRRVCVVGVRERTSFEHAHAKGLEVLRRHDSLDRLDVDLRSGVAKRRHRERRKPARRHERQRVARGGTRHARQRAQTGLQRIHQLYPSLRRIVGRHRHSRCQQVDRVVAPVGVKERDETPCEKRRADEEYARDSHLTAHDQDARPCRSRPQASPARGVAALGERRRQIDASRVEHRHERTGHARRHRHQKPEQQDAAVDRDRVEPRESPPATSTAAPGSWPRPAQGRPLRRRARASRSRSRVAARDARRRHRWRRESPAPDDGWSRVRAAGSRRWPSPSPAAMRRQRASPELPASPLP